MATQSIYFGRFKMNKDFSNDECVEILSNLNVNYICIRRRNVRKSIR